MRGAVQCRLGDNAAVDCSQGRFTVTGLTKGQHTLRVTASDALGNTASTRFTWSVDFGPPRIKIVVSPDRFTSSATAIFRLWSKSDPALFLCTLDDLPEMPCETNEILGPFPEGLHRCVTVWGLDAADEPLGSSLLPLGCRHDLLPGVDLRRERPKMARCTPDPSASFDIWQSEPGQIFCSLDASEFVACATPVSYSGLADGAHTFQVYVRDRAGNVSITASRSWIVDLAAP